MNEQANNAQVTGINPGDVHRAAIESKERYWRAHKALIDARALFDKAQGEEGRLRRMFQALYNVCVELQVPIAWEPTPAEKVSWMGGDDEAPDSGVCLKDLEEFGLSDD